MHNDYARNRETLFAPVVPCRVMETRACMTNIIRWDGPTPIGYEYAAEPCVVFCVRFDRELTGE